MRIRLIHGIVLAAIALPLAASLGPLASGARIVAYRDSAHFYYPLYAWITAQWGRGELPLWNPQQGTGLPVVAEATSAVWYPGKLVFALPGSYPLRFNAYVILHVLLATTGTYATARSWRTSRAAAGLAAVSYGAGGGVLFQTCNVVYLVGAAWLPWALLATDHLLRQRSRRAALGLGTALACMVLGGDPQLAYHAGLLAVLYALLLGRNPEIDRPATACPAESRVWRPLPLLALAALTAMLLSAVQIVPALQWVSTSRRAVYQQPRSLWEIPAYWSRPAEPDNPSAAARWQGSLAGLCGPPAAGTHRRQAYDFSLAPWRCVELIWPNITGRTLPRNQRWLAAAGGEDRIWTPSLYLGLLPLWLAGRTWTLRGPDRRTRWLSWIVLLGILGSFGWYGPGWLYHQLRTMVHADAAPSTIGAPTGGLYWLLVVALPGYAEFRFPAKLFTCAGLGLSLLSAGGLDNLWRNGRLRFRRSLALLALVSLLLAGLVWWGRAWWSIAFAAPPADELFGPLDRDGAWRGILIACGHTTLIAASGWWIVGGQKFRPAVGRSLLLLLTGLELVVANRWLVVTAPAAAVRTDSVLWQTLNTQTRVAGHTGQSGPRFFRPPERTEVPPHWLATAAADRPAETVAWDRATLFPNYHLLEPLTSLAPQRTLEPNDYWALWHSGPGPAPHPHVLNLLGADYLVLPTDRSWPGAERIAGNSAIPPNNVHVWRNRRAYPRAWVVHELRGCESRKTHDPRQVARRWKDLLFAGDQPRDLRQVAAVDPQELAAAGRLLPKLAAAPQFAATCHVVPTGANQLRVDARLDVAGLLVVNDLYAPGWRAEVQSNADPPHAAPILRANLMMRGICLPAGQHRVVFTYQPIDQYVAGAVSLACWWLLLAGLAWQTARRMRLRASGRRARAALRPPAA